MRRTLKPPAHRRSTRATPRWTVFSLLLITLVVPAAAQDAGSRFDLGLRADLLAADGEPTNDMPGAGIYARYRLSDRWLLGVAVDQASGFDVERPYQILGLSLDESLGEIDAAGDMTAVTLWLEREHARPGRLAWFWGVGLGAATVDVDDLPGTLTGGAPALVRQEVGTELLATATAGLRIRLGRRWALEPALRLEQHFTDWTLTETVSGRTAQVDDYLLRGIHLGLGVRF